MIGLYKLESLNLERLSFITKLQNDMNRLLPMDIVARIGGYDDPSSEHMDDEMYPVNVLQSRRWSRVDYSFIRSFNIDHIEYLTDSQLIGMSPLRDEPLIIAFCNSGLVTHVFKMLRVSKFRGNIYYQLVSILIASPFYHMIEHIGEYIDGDYKKVHKKVHSMGYIEEFKDWSYTSPCIRHFNIDDIKYLTIPQLIMITNDENIPLIVVFWTAKRYTIAVKMIRVARSHGDIYGNSLEKLLFDHPLCKGVPYDFSENY